MNWTNNTLAQGKLNFEFISYYNCVYAAMVNTMINVEFMNTVSKIFMNYLLHFHQSFAVQYNK